VNGTLFPANLTISFFWLESNFQTSR